MIDFRYALEKGSRKNICSECGKKIFVRYQDDETREYLPEEYGRCDREIKCGYHHNPYTDQQYQITARENSTTWQPRLNRKNKSKPASKLFPIPLDVLSSTLGGYDQNKFVQNLLTNVPFPFDSMDIERVIAQYYLGTEQSGYLAGAVTFPFIDMQGRVMAIQVKKFDHSNHSARTSFLHKIIENELYNKGEPLPEWLKNYNTNDKKVTCLFGAHLLSRYPNNPVALVEAPKSAVYASLYYGPPQRLNDLLWLAVYNLSSLTLDKCHVLKGRKVILFPDLSLDGKAYRLWEQRVSEFKRSIPGVKFVISDLLEKNAADADRERGLDLADYLIRMDWRAFRPKISAPERKVVLPANVAVEEVVEQVEIIEPPTETQPDVQLPEHHLCSFLDQRKQEWVVWPVEELVAFFDEVVLPESAIQLDTATQIVDVQKYIASNLHMVQANNGNPAFKPYLDRLYKLKSIIHNDHPN